ncbi:MAG TPA: DUF1761 domain-containing protein [Candidatus Baltobacteraceae bacterium]|nr:DUF1761 domain-containing protein [Candidatus Baltobacteraceae bacterium]
MTARINHLAVFVSAIAFFLLGALWYTVLFGHTWMQLTGAAEKPAGNMAAPFIGSFILDWILAYVMAIALSKSDNPNMVRHGVEFGVFMGLGVFGTMSLMNFLYEGRSFALWAIDAAYVIAGMAIMGAIIGAWRTKIAPVTT